MQTLGRYRIEAMIGEGAMAEVYRAHDPDIGRAVAVKVLKPDFARDADLEARFLREARAAGALSHQNIATIYDVGQAQGIAYIAMELVEGQPLDAVLAAQGRLPYERVLTLARQLGDALAYAHRAGIVHRDVKPSNILVSADGQQVKLVDFGVARLGESDAGQLGRTHAGQLVGTPRYMSPEQALGLPVDHRADLFSLGVVLYEMMTGKVAFPGTGLATLAIQIAQERVEPVGRIVGDCPPGFAFIIDKLLAKKPDARFQDGAQLVAAIDREIGHAKDVEPARRGLPLGLKLPLALAAVTALALGASIVSILDRQQSALEHMALVSGETIASFVTGNAAVLAADNAGLPPAEQDWAPLQAFVAAAARDANVREIAVVGAGGVIRAATDPARVGTRYRPPSGEPAFGGDPRATDAGGTGIRFVRPIDYAGIEFGRVDLVLKRTALDGAVANARAMMAALAAIVMLAVLGVGYLSGSMVARPLRRLRTALAEAADNGFALRISHRRRDEIGAAFDAFNRTAEAMETRLAAGPAAPTPDLRATQIVARAA
ncbi:serine/threonine-protein kinase [Sphingomonas sp. Y38-1Y]|uniref:serine/threonine-protein kinase n=1 Tax=Sphingomonas sp. Y38-1Y TaxID=3078265 RepID=UPI0028EB07F5|nr:protein kinase [Sphingomonas sp. Y38-1Y]